ncbi:MAG TPA: hypothetical protein VFV33_02015 [Gemmatimonadaceae bacterium]|nr:hypothetical protein [Gemmatimonadaceae bacterium]
MLHRTPLRDGMIAGALGASVIAGWTLVIDAFTDRIGVTGALIGAWIYDALGAGFGGRGFGAHFLTWLVALFIGVIVIGVVASFLYHASETKPSLAFGLVMLVIVLELILLSLTALASQNPLFGGAAWLYGLTGNVLGAFAIGRYLWRAHHPANTWDWHDANDRHFHAGVKKV